METVTSKLANQLVESFKTHSINLKFLQYFCFFSFGHAVRELMKFLLECQYFSVNKSFLILSLMHRDHQIAYIIVQGARKVNVYIYILFIFWDLPLLLHSLGLLCNDPWWFLQNGSWFEVISRYRMVPRISFRIALFIVDWFLLLVIWITCFVIIEFDGIRHNLESFIFWWGDWNDSSTHFL